MSNILRLIGIGAALTISAVLVAGTVYEATARRITAREFPPPGKLAEIGGRRIHIDCHGSGRPTVILEAGADTSGSALWYPVIQTVSATTRVCAYDRAGLMWSDPGPLPRDGEAIIVDLQKTLEVTNERGPYVMVGASLGGPLVMLYTKRHPTAVAGVVLVDSAHPDQIKRLEAASGIEDDPAPLLFRVIAALSWTGLPRLLLPTPELPELPDHVSAAVAAYQTPSLQSALDEAVAMPATFQQAGTFRDLGNRPLAVLSHGKKWGDYNKSQQESAGMSEDQFERRESAWAAMQDEEAAWSQDSTHQTLRDSSHVVQLERPDAVISAINDVVAKVRRVSSEASD
ncbi:alpha/beta hydrolase [Shinella sp.]|uniref:alpha/beta fold hydrolase n=1 Tax=Shinella sp. TaxID=1870904 RepID=UPI0028ABFE36|nr:alpha/beta hydrolase [Shinella sp.]